MVNDDARWMNNGKYKTCCSTCIAVNATQRAQRNIFSRYVVFKYIVHCIQVFVFWFRKNARKNIKDVKSVLEKCCSQQIL